MNFEEHAAKSLILAAAGVNVPRGILCASAKEAAAAAGEICPVEIERDADLILHLLLAYAYAFMGHAIPGEPDQVAAYVWGFCLAALRRGSSEPGPTVVAPDSARHLDQRAM